MGEWLLVGVFFAACWVLNRWAFQRDVERAVREMEKGSCKSRLRNP